MQMTTALEIATDHGYSVDTWENFSNHSSLPEGLLERALGTKAKCEARGETVSHVLFDLDDDDEGFLILGNDPEDMCFELCDGKLEDDERWQGLVRPSTGVTVGSAMTI
jgi:hypothetical protein